VQSTENNPDPRSEVDALIVELRGFSRAMTVQGMTLTGDRYARSAAALAAERDRADRWAAQVAAIENVLDDHAFDDEDGNGFVPIGPLQDALFGKQATA
jgi:hypothetical protein